MLSESKAFGDGTHETTAMCLQALAVFAPKTPFRMLDAGSGTGILSIAAAKLGGTPIGVEIDPAANEVARENAKRNGLAIAFDTDWPKGEFDVVVANILRDILLALAPALLAQRAENGLLILSGLVSTDVPSIVAAYAPSLGGRRPEIFERGPWRTLVWRIPSPR